jgi:hypothetical protein
MKMLSIKEFTFNRKHFSFLKQFKDTFTVFFKKKSFSDLIFYYPLFIFLVEIFVHKSGKKHQFLLLDNMITIPS